MAAFNSFILFKKNTPQTKMKRTSAVLSRPSYLTVWKMMEPEEREDDNDSTDDGSVASTSTAPTALPHKQLLVKDPSDVHRLESRNVE